MSARNYQLTITAAPQRLSAALPDTERGGKQDEACRQILLQTETDCFIGASSAMTTSIYGFKLLSATTTPVPIGPFPDGPVKLSDIFVIGTSGVLHIFTIPY
jgi:hypothetical protein